MMMNEGHALSLRAREEAAARARRAQDAAAREAARERGQEPLSCPAEANAQQRAAWHGAMDEILMRERAASKIGRGWQRLPRTKAPAGHIPLCALWGARMVILAVDLRGAIRLVEGRKPGAAVTVSEAVAIAAECVAD